MPNAYISGSGMYVPETVIKNDDLKKIYGIDTDHEWIHKRSGIEERRFAPEGVNASDLAVPAAKQAVEDAGIEMKDLDMIIFGTLSPDAIFPGSGVYLQQKLGLCDGPNPNFVPCLDVRNQCSAFIYSLATAASMVKAGGCKNVLIVGAECHSAAMDMSTRGRQVSSLFGDAAAAVVVSQTEEDRGVRGWYLGADGRYADSLCLKGWDMRRRPYIPVGDDDCGRVTPEMMWPYMEGKLVFRNAVERMIQSLMKACSDHEITRDDIDLFLFHQANMRINQYVADQIGIPEDRLVHNLHKYGNTTAATIPLLIAEATRNGKLERGMKVAMVAFGSGFTWGSAIVDW